MPVAMEPQGGITKLASFSSLSWSYDLQLWVAAGSRFQ